MTYTYSAEQKRAAIERELEYRARVYSQRRHAALRRATQRLAPLRNATLYRATPQRRAMMQVKALEIRDEQTFIVNYPL